MFLFYTFFTEATVVSLCWLKSECFFLCAVGLFLSVNAINCNSPVSVYYFFVKVFSIVYTYQCSNLYSIANSGLAIAWSTHSITQYYKLWPGYI